MKKTLLICSALVIGASVFAQNGRQIKNLKAYPVKKTNSVDQEVFPAAGTKNIAGPVAAGKTSSACIPKRFTSGPNVLTLIGNGSTQQNVLSYNMDLNTVVFTHRRSADWVFSGRTSGAIESTWLDKGTGAWDSMIVYRDSTNAFGGRYPSGINFNPVGNTNGLAGSYMVACGPANVGGSFTGTYRAVRSVSGNFHAIPANDKDTCSVGRPPLGNTDGYQFNADLQQVGNTIWLAAGLIDPKVTSANGSGYKGASIVKGTYSGGNVTWTVDSIIPGYALDPNLSSGTGYASSNGLSPRIGFDPSGTVGYVVMFGTLAATSGNSSDSMVAPIVYKTVNGGSTWTSVMANYDWNTAHPEVLKNCFDPATGPSKNFSFEYSYYQNQHGMDIAVDAAGNLHLVSTVNAPYKDGARKDSMNFGYKTGYWDYVTSHPIVWDFMTDGTCWKTMMVDSILTSHVGDGTGDTTSTKNPWEAGASSGTYYNYGAHLTLSRSTDGTKIIYGWGESDASQTKWNTSPDMFMKAYDVSTGKFTPTTNVTNGINTCYYSYLSDNAYFDGTQNKWVAPFVYTIGRTTTTQGYDGNLPVDFYYGNCGAFGTADFTMNAVINNDLLTPACAVNVKTNNAFVASVNNYPNPFNHTTNIVVSLNDNKPVSVSVYDAIGKVVFTKTINGNIGENTIVFDGSNLNAGVYYYTVTAGYEKATKKMVISK